MQIILITTSLILLGITFFAAMVVKQRHEINESLAEETLHTSIKHYLRELYKALGKSRDEEIILLPLRNLSNQLSLYFCLGGNAEDLGLLSEILREDFGSFRKPSDLVIIGRQKQNLILNAIFGPIANAFIRVRCQDGTSLLYNFNPLKQNTLERVEEQNNN